MATAEKRVVTDATGQAMLAELRKIPGVMNPVPVEKGGTGVTTPEGIRELINAQEKLNFDVEEELNKRAKSVNGILPDELGNIQVLHVAEADNFSSDEAQTVSGTFIERTTGGDASIHDGTANLTALYGYSVRSGYSEETKSFQVIPAGRLDDSEPISAEINWSTYKTAVNNVSTNKTFTYGVSGWNENPETYGITVSGTPATGDVMNVYFTAEVRGAITNTTPQTFVETGWNLYDHTNGYARVLKYSEDYGFMIGGTYTGIAFAETVEGAQTVLTPDSNGIFTIPSDGYVFVTGGNNTDTFILMTWSDWGEGYTGEFETYSESVVDLSELMSNAFPYGMCNIGIVYDEINFNDKTAYVRIERQAYTAENLINAEATGRAFTYDADYIYIVKETPEKIRFNISSEVTVYDHGTEYFTGTDLPVLTYQLFGQNLKDKLRREVVAVTPQNFSVAQKAIARQNIDAAFDQEVIKTINHKTPDQYGDITIVEGTANASYGLYRINATIQPAAWSLVNGAYQIAYADPLIKSDMDGMETWLDNPEAMKGKTRFTTIDGALIISTAVQPTETWGLHVALGTNGATVLEQVANKAEENTVALVEHDDTAFHSIAVGQYVLWKGALYQAKAAIAAGNTLAATGNSANLTAKSNGIGNEIHAEVSSLSDAAVKVSGSQTIAGTKTFDGSTIFGGTHYIKNSATAPLIYFQGKNLSSYGASLMAYGIETSESKYGASQFRLREYSPNSDGSAKLSYYEDFAFPAVDVNRSSSKTYKVLTEKNAVTVPQGGTGATTVADARTNLGVPPISHAVNANTYGIGTASVYGHVKTSDTYSGTPSTSAKAANAITASQWALQTAYQKATTFVAGETYYFQQVFVGKANNDKTGYFGSITLPKDVGSLSIAVSNLAQYGVWYSDGASHTLTLGDATVNTSATTANTVWLLIPASGISSASTIAWLRLGGTFKFS